MSGVSISEQMGAMALIDELRHSQTEIQKHLDLPKHRKAVAERIREFYKARGVEVEDTLVEQGVRNYFATRLTYEAPVLNWRDRLLAPLYINRNGLLKQTLIWTPIMLWSFYAWGQVFESFGEAQLHYAQSELNNALVLAETQPQQVLRLQQQIDVLAGEIAATQLGSASRMLEQARRMLEKASRLTPIKLSPHTVTVQSRSQDLDRVLAAKRSLKKDAAALEAVQARLDDVSRLLAADQKRVALMSGQSWRTVSRTSPEVTVAAAKARAALDQADTLGVAAGVTAVAQLDELIEQNSLSPSYQLALDDAREAVRKMNLSQADQPAFKVLFSSVQQAIDAADATSAARGLKDIERLKAFAATSLTLNVVSRTGEKSMVERNYDPTGGKTWYLLTEATDAAGNVVPVPITSRETGEKRYAPIFGVRVSRATYQEVKNDKLADGHVDNRRMGSKDANSLTLKFLKGRASAKPDYILEW
ncbi:DUF6384 family protein [Pseudomonas sp. LD120]|uniref:DUF6384 family protein n=1 Tax=Pseudomonas sp. LD120 TaxID=485751 RepID=UPI001357021A|nr:DUF6384 family protein [Pseudomonas sp. LD120]KAF0863516.1 hypothetical protein PLD_22960 [Pseudomonas sp. LD120]